MVIKECDSDVILPLEEQSKKLASLKHYLTTQNNFSNTPPTIFLEQILNEIKKDEDFDNDLWLRHSLGVGFLSEKISKGYGLSSRECEEVLIAGILHDIGKILGINKYVLGRDGSLTNEEKNTLKIHPWLGCLFLEYLDQDGIFGVNREKIKKAILDHHEREDGSGYPFGKKGKEISLYGGIVGIADMFHAGIDPKRVWKKPLSIDEFKKSDKELKRKFNKYVVEAFIEILGEPDVKNYISDLQSKNGINDFENNHLLWVYLKTNLQ